MGTTNIDGFSAVQIGNRIREEIKMQNISVIQMSNDIFMSTRGIYRLLVGKVYPSLYSAVIIAEYLGISLDYLLLGKR